MKKKATARPAKATSRQPTLNFPTSSEADLLARQTRIVAEVERRLSVVEELEAVVSANLQRASRLRQSILQKAFTGELTGADTYDHGLQVQQRRN